MKYNFVQKGKNSVNEQVSGTLKSSVIRGAGCIKNISIELPVITGKYTKYLW
jgi:hypothetical protein